MAANNNNHSPLNIRLSTGKTLDSSKENSSKHHDNQPYFLGYNQALKIQHQDISLTILDILEQSPCKDHTCRVQTRNKKSGVIRCNDTEAEAG